MFAKDFIKKFIKLKHRYLIKHYYCRVRYRGNLRKIASFWGTDKEGSHFYAQHYEKYFSHLKNKPITLLEIGIGGYSNPFAGGESLRMWETFFPKATIVGIDIYEKSFPRSSRIKTYCGSQIDKDFLLQVINEVGPPDIIIDDGSHLNKHVIETFNILFPYLSVNGFYCIEDLQTSYWTFVNGIQWDGARELNADHTSISFLKNLVDGLNYEEFQIENYVPTYFDQNIIGIHFFHNLAIIEKGPNCEGSNILK